MFEKAKSLFLHLFAGFVDPVFTGVSVLFDSNNIPKPVKTGVHNCKH